MKLRVRAEALIFKCARKMFSAHDKVSRLDIHKILYLDRPLGAEAFHCLETPRETFHMSCNGSVDIIFTFVTQRFSNTQRLGGWDSECAAFVEEELDRIDVVV